MTFLAYNRGKVIDKAPASEATFHEADPVTVESTGGVNFLRKFSSSENGMRRYDSSWVLKTFNAEDEEDQLTPITKKTRVPLPTPIIEGTAFMRRKWQDGDSASKANKTNKKVSFRMDEPKFELDDGDDDDDDECVLNFQGPLIFYQLILFDGNLVPEKIIYLSSETVHS
jgi:hypothetical protein